jgi:2-phospho-L-lactate/phosphoenolpyruvate guanylyltransferase
VVPGRIARVTSPLSGQVAPAAVRWGVVVPVKHLDVAKSRLAVLGDDGRRALALAFAEDVVLAALGCAVVRRVLVVTDDRRAERALRALGADVTRDRPDAGLNAALEHGERVLRSTEPSSGVAAVSADLPALRPVDLAAVLTATRTRAVVADAQGSGTTLLAAAPGWALAPAYGERSLARHLASGAERLDGPPGARRDVDTPADLEQALRLGVGARTAAAASSVGLPGAADERPPAAVVGGEVDCRHGGQGTMLP